MRRHSTARATVICSQRGKDCMTITATTAARPVGPIAVVTAGVGAALFVYGLLLLPVSTLGGLWIVAVGLSFVLSGAFAAPWVVAQLGITATRAERLSLVFALLGVLLLVAFVLLSGMQFDTGETTGRSSG